MNLHRLVSSVQPFVAAVALIITAALLVAAIYFTRLDLQWTGFLGGILVAATLSVVTRAARVEVVASRRGEELTVAREQLSQDTAAREAAEAALAEARARLKFLDESLPALIAFVDAEGVYRYHNDAFRRWLDLPPHRINGQHMRNVLGKSAFAAVEAQVERAGQGETVRYERTQRMPNGAVYRMHVEYLPVFDGRGKYNGFFVVMSDLTERHHLFSQTNPHLTAMPGAVLSAAPPAQPAAPPAAQGAFAAAQPGPSLAQPAAAVRPAMRPTQSAPPPAAPAAAEESFGSAIAQQATGWTNARDRIIAAIERNEFTLFCQLITPLAAGSGRVAHYEILIRLSEEEDNLIPPGAFFPLAEEHGLLPRLDRWVVAHLLAWAVKNPGAADRTFFINVATATMSDPDFPDFVAHELHKSGLPGGTMCFEIAQGDYLTNRDDIGEFVRQVKLAGCRVALAGFGRDRVSVDLLKSLPLDFLKIDGGLVLQMARDAVGVTRVAAINRVARTIGIATVAEMVEDEATIAKLREIEVDYAQGFGISRPGPLAKLGVPAAPGAPGARV